MFDMIALAFQTDTTRICTFMFGNEVSNTNFSFLDGVKGGHHDTSHHQKDPDKLRQYQLINRWHIEQYAYLLRKLRNMKEGESTVLDNSMVLFGSGIRDGDAHNPHNVPLVLAGRGGGRSPPDSIWSTRRTARCRTSTSRCSMPSARRWSGSPTAPGPRAAC